MDAIGGLDELTPTRGRLARVRYTHIDMIDFLISHPEASQGDLALRYGYTQAWVSNIMASDAWQSQYEKRRGELVDPALVLSIQERFKALALRSMEVLMEKLEKPQVSDNIVLKAVELGARGIELGGFGRPSVPPPAFTAPEDRLSRLAERLETLHGTRLPETIDAQVIEK